MSLPSERAAQPPSEIVEGRAKWTGKIIRARSEGHFFHRVHNDLSNGAYHFKNLIEANAKAQNREGRSFDQMACLVMLAFAIEAQLNFLGAELIHEWNERESFDTKLKQILAHIGLEPDFSARPYNSIARLKRFRDFIAHAKPSVTRYDEVVEGLPDKLDVMDIPDNPWAEYCNDDFLFPTYDDMDKVWKEMLVASGISYFDSISQGKRSLTFIERVEEGTSGASQ